MGQMRLDKFLAQNGAGTRSEVKQLVRAGRVAVNEAPAKQADSKIDPENDVICLDGKKLSWEPFLCLMLYKPQGCITATSDRSAKTVMDSIDHARKAELFPVGRLDLDTEGLLLLMNDGALAHRILSPAHHVEKTYFVRVAGALTQEDCKAFEAGLEIGEKRPTLPAELRILHNPAAPAGENTEADAGEQDKCLKHDIISEAEITIREGKYHQVKRMFAARGKQVLYLKRISMAGIALDETLAPGEWRELTEREKDVLAALRTEK